MGRNVPKLCKGPTISPPWKVLKEELGPLTVAKSAPNQGLPVALSRAQMNWQSTPSTKHGALVPKMSLNQIIPYLSEGRNDDSHVWMVCYLWGKLRLKFLVGPCLLGSWTFYLSIIKNWIKVCSGQGTIPDLGRSGHGSSTSRFWLCSLSVHIPFPVRKGWNTDLSVGFCVHPHCLNCAVLKFLSEL